MAEAVGCPCRPCDCIREDYFFPSQDAPGRSPGIGRSDGAVYEKLSSDVCNGRNRRDCGGHSVVGMRM